jgi:TRAP transporter 4TM/12TM fusion protein
MPKGITYYIFATVAISISIFELWLGSIGNLSPYHYSVIFLTGILSVAIITTRISRKATSKPSVFDYIFATLVMASGVYLILKMDFLLVRISGVDRLSLLDIAVAIILIVAVLELCRRTLGVGLTSILLLGIGYAYFGHLIPGTFGHRPLSNQRILEELIFTTNGIFGAPVQVAATYAFLFVMFGYFFKISGAGQFIFDCCASLVGKKVGGLAKVAVTTSAAFGSISGSPTSDVATTGSITIPNMKKQGYDPVFAGAVETSASSGGTILPPIMGSVAFLMAEFTGIPYFDIVVASVLGAILYYLGVYWQVHFRSIKLNLGAMEQKDIPNLWRTLSTGFYYAFPVIILIGAMVKGYTPSLAATYGIGAAFLISFVRRNTWITIKRLLEIFTEVVYQIAPLAVATAAAGIIIGVINLSGLAGKFTSLIFLLTGENIFLALVVGAIVCIILGMGMPTPSVYVLVAALVAPALIRLGLEVMPVHLFLVFFCALSAITPPVGVAAYTAAGIANANPLAVGIQATKLSFVGFVIPFMFIYQPSLLLQGSLGEIALTVTTAVIGVYALAAGMEGYINGYLKLWQRVLLVIAAVGVIYPSFGINLFGVIIILFFFLKNRIFKNKETEDKPATINN